MRLTRRKYGWLGVRFCTSSVIKAELLPHLTVQVNVQSFKWVITLVKNRICPLLGWLCAPCRFSIVCVCMCVFLLSSAFCLDFSQWLRLLDPRHACKNYHVRGPFRSKPK